MNTLKLGAKWVITRLLVFFTNVIKIGVINNPCTLQMLIMSILFIVFYFTYVNRWCKKSENYGFLKMWRNVCYPTLLCSRKFDYIMLNIDTINAGYTQCIVLHFR